MAWKLSDGGFQVIPEGEYVFKITGVKWDEDFGKLEIILETQNGYKHTERYNLINQDGEINEKANNAYSYLARIALNNPSLDEIDHEDLVGCYIKASVEHEKVPSNKDPAKMLTFARLGDKSPASGFGESKASSEPAPAHKKSGGSKSSVNLDDILG